MRARGLLATPAEWAARDTIPDNLLWSERPLTDLDSLCAAQRIAHRRIEEWRAQVEPCGEKLYRDAAHRFVILANEFLERMHAAREPGFRSLPTDIGSENSFRVRSRFYEHDLLSHTGRTQLSWLLDVVLPPAAWRRALLREVSVYLESLLATNTSRIAADLNERVNASRRLLEADLRSLLRQVVEAADRSIRRACEAQKTGKTQVESLLSRTDENRKQVQDLLAS